MREILFRGKRADNGEWVEGYLLSTVNHTYIVYTDQYDDDLFFSPKNIFIAVDPETVGQYTGLTDKNGKKIFEGDVINAYHNRDLLNVSYVVFDSGEFLCELISGNFIDCCETLPEQETECGIEIIGNIHDNPELLKRCENISKWNAK